MSELTLTLLRLGFLVLLWVLVLAILGVLRRDLFGTRIVARSRRGGDAGGPAGRRPPRQPGGATGRSRSAPAACAPWS